MLKVKQKFKKFTTYTFFLKIFDMNFKIIETSPKNKPAHKNLTDKDIKDFLKNTYLNTFPNMDFFVTLFENPIPLI